MGAVATMKVQKDGQVVKVNRSDVAEWIAKGWQTVGAAPKAKTAPVAKKKPAKKK